MKKLFQTIGSAIYNPEFYRGARTEPAKDAWKYYFKFVLIAAVCFTLIVGSRLVPFFMSVFTEENLNKVINHFPEELTITIKDGVASSNVKEPYAIKVPTSLKNKLNELDANTPRPPIAQYENFLVIDTGAGFDIEKFDSYQTMALLTKDLLISEKNRGGELSIQRLAGLGNLTVNREVIRSWGEKILPLKKFLLPLFILGLFVAGFFTIGVMNLLILVAFAFVAWLIILIRKMGLTYGETYRLGLYALTAPILVNLVMSFLVWQTWLFPYLLIFLIAFFLNVRKSSIETKSLF